MGHQRCHLCDVEARDTLGLSWLPSKFWNATMIIRMKEWVWFLVTMGTQTSQVFLTMIANGTCNDVSQDDNARMKTSTTTYIPGSSRIVGDTVWVDFLGKPKRQKTDAHQNMGGGYRSRTFWEAPYWQVSEWPTRNKSTLIFLRTDKAVQSRIDFYFQFKRV